jgi:hypothetical protein
MGQEWDFAREKMSPGQNDVYVQTDVFEVSAEGGWVIGVDYTFYKVGGRGSVKLAFEESMEAAVGKDEAMQIFCG